MIKRMTIVLLAMLCAAQAKSSYLLSLDFEKDSLGVQSEAGLPALEPFNSVKSVAGTADFGDSGYLQLEEFPHPVGAFTLEALLRPHAYAPQQTRFISDLANTATWEGGPNQGFIYRIGGGHFYPVLPKGAYGTPPLYDQSVAGYDNAARAYLSRCLGELAFATKDGTAAWLEVFTDRCVDLDRWTHFVAVWDGKEARLYMNGLEATDPWRRNGAGSQPFFNPTTLLTVGARYGGEFDNRHFNGAMDFIRILDTAMAEGQIRQRYRETLKSDSGTDFCSGRIVPVSPLAGELCDSGCTFRFKVTAGGACTDPTKLPELQPGDSVEIEFSDEPDFHDPFLRITVSQTSFRIDEELRAKVAEFDGPCFWRARLKSKAAALAKGSAEATPLDWSEPKPFLLNYVNPLGIREVRGGLQSRLKAVAGGYLLEGLPGALPPRLYRMDGRLAAIGQARGLGTWFLPLSGEHGMLLVKTPRGVFRLALH